MKILATVPLVPWPLDRGDRMRAWELLGELSNHGEVTIALVTRERVSSEALRALASRSSAVRVYDIGRPTWNAVAGIVDGLPPALGAYRNLRAASKIQAQAEMWDLVVAFQLRTAPYALAVGAKVRAIDFTDSLAMFRRRLPRSGRSGFQWLLLTGIGRVERRIPPKFDLCWVSAADDAEMIATLSGYHPTVVPNGSVPSEAIAPYQHEGPLLFMGDMRYPANEDGIVRFVGTTWPAIRSRVPGSRLRIVGRTTRRVARLAGRPGVDLVGPLDDVTDEIAAAAAVVNPVRYGSGSSRKILTGWAAARPVISTRAGLRGLTFDEGGDILVADTSEQWVDAITWMRANPNAASELGRAGWRRVCATYDARHVWAGALPAGLLAGRVGASTGIQHDGQASASSVAELHLRVEHHR